MIEPLACPICGGDCAPLDSLDFNKTCLELPDGPLPVAGVPVAYFLCDECGFCFAPEFAHWTLEAFATRIYNSEYVRVDPEYVQKRPLENADYLQSLLGARGSSIRHLDYGGGQGLLSERLRQNGWQSVSYDPFVDVDNDFEALGKFDLITAFEVFEHVPDVWALAANLSALLVDDGVVLFSTLLSDGYINRGQGLDWWYAAPRNGHISLFSRGSLAVLAASQGLNYCSFSDNFHAYCRDAIPSWASHWLRFE